MDMFNESMGKLTQGKGRDANKKSTAIDEIHSYTKYAI